jgi:hypothetical protein
MAEMKFNCPKCAQVIACDELWGGHQIQCPTCQAEITVPAKEATAAQAPASGSDAPNSLVPQPPAATKLSIGRAQHQPAPGPPQPSPAVTAFRRQMQPPAVKKKSAAMKYVTIGIVVLALAAGVYFGYPLVSKWRENANAKSQEADKTADSGQAGPRPAGAGPMAAGGAPVASKDLPVVPAVWTLDVPMAKIPEGRVNGMISGTNFVAETVRLDPVGGALVLRFFQGAALAPDREMLVYLHLKPGEKLAEHTWTISQDMKGTGVPQVAKRWKLDPKYAPKLQNYASGYAMKLEFGQVTNGSSSGKIFLALPDAEHSVAAGSFTAESTIPDPAAAAAAAAAQAAQPAAPVDGRSAADRATFDKRYGIKH